MLAAAFGVAGLTHATRPIAEMAKLAPWTGALPEGLVRFIGVVELAGALGLVLPGLTRRRPALTGWAAAGLAAVMALAMVVHIARGEPQVLPVNVVLGGIAAFIAWGRGMNGEANDEHEHEHERQRGCRPSTCPTAAGRGRGWTCASWSRTRRSAR